MTKTATPTTAEYPTPMYSDVEALDEAVLRLLRKLRYRHNDALTAVWKQLPDGAKEALNAAEHRADHVRNADQLNGIPLCTRPYPSQFENEDEN